MTARRTGAFAAALLLLLVVAAACIVGIPIPRALLPANLSHPAPGSTLAFTSLRLMPLRWSYTAQHAAYQGADGTTLQADTLQFPAGIGGAPPWHIRQAQATNAHLTAPSGVSLAAGTLALSGATIPANTGTASLLSPASGLAYDHLVLDHVTADQNGTALTAAHIEANGYRAGILNSITLSGLTVSAYATGQRIATSITAQSVTLEHFNALQPKSNLTPSVRFTGAGFTAGAARMEVAAGAISSSGDSPSLVSARFTGGHLFWPGPQRPLPLIQAGWPDGFQFSVVLTALADRAQGAVDLRHLSIDMPGTGIFDLAMKVRRDPASPPNALGTPISPAALQLVSGSFTVTDHGLQQRLLNALTGTGKDPATAKSAIRAGIVNLATIAPAQPDAATQLGQYADKPGTLAMSFNPSEPLRLVTMALQGPAPLNASIHYTPP